MRRDSPRNVRRVSSRARSRHTARFCRRPDLAVSRARPVPSWHSRTSVERSILTLSSSSDDLFDVTHEDWMKHALAEAARGGELGEVPVGALVVVGDRAVGRGFNQPISAVDPTAHAEVVALREAARTIGNYRLTGATLYVTVEPCMMCVGAMVHARVGLVVYGAPEPKAGALASAMRAHETPALNHRLDVIGGVLEEECRAMMQAFFRAARER